MDRIDRLYVKNVLPYRDPCGHKGTFGKVLCICGSVGYTGAPIFASRAAVRTGSGLVFLAVPESIWQVVAVRSDEAMPFPMSDVDGKLHGCFKAIAARAEGCDAVLYGCGLGRSDALDEMVRDVLTLPQPLVLDLVFCIRQREATFTVSNPYTQFAATERTKHHTLVFRNLKRNKSAFKLM